MKFWEYRNLYQTWDKTQWHGEVAVLFWGIAFPPNLDEDEPPAPWEGEEKVFQWRHRFNNRSHGSSLEELGCRIHFYGHGGIVVPYLAIEASEQWVIRSGSIPQPVSNLEWRSKLSQFCEIMVIPWQEPDWYIAAGDAGCS